MKRIFKYCFDNSSYKLKLNDEDKFVINKFTLEFNGNQFYENIFKEYSDGDELEIKNEMTDEEMQSDKFAQPILDTINEIKDSIIKRLSEEKNQ